MIFDEHADPLEPALAERRAGRRGIVGDVGAQDLRRGERDRRIGVAGDRGGERRAQRRRQRPRYELERSDAQRRIGIAERGGEIEAESAGSSTCASAAAVSSAATRTSIKRARARAIASKSRAPGRDVIRREVVGELVARRARVAIARAARAAGIAVRRSGPSATRASAGSSSARSSTRGAATIAASWSARILRLRARARRPPGPRARPGARPRRGRRARYAAVIERPGGQQRGASRRDRLAFDPAIRLSEIRKKN